ncbi:MAG: hypothetical protein K9H26_05590 [Prolixibacteraceae bacterium]|nr:hypothetical protein [Prolixibacteraceae bacterium]
MKLIRLKFVTIALGLLLFTACSNTPVNYAEVETPPALFPDYTSVTIPPNIAPLNFKIEETGEKYCVGISSENGRAISFKQVSPVIQIPLKKWQNLLSKNAGEKLKLDIFVKNGTWTKYQTVTNYIAPDSIDNTLVYRMIGVITTDADKQGIYQRNLSDFEQKAIFENTSTPKRSCINCHSFNKNNPGKMTLHFRKAYPGTLLFDNGKLTKYNTKTPYTMSPCAYTAWHPSGKYIAFTTNRLYEFCTSSFERTVEVYDQASDIILFNTETATISISPKIASGSRENLPNWSPDGRWLYFVSAPKVTGDNSNLVSAKYDLLRIPFNEENMEWGDVDTLLTSARTGKSISFPKVSPDGRYILFGMVDYGYFTIFDMRSDLGLYDLHKHTWSKTNSINSPSADGYHSWSKNGRWVVFSSKRMDDIRARPFFAWFDSLGNFHKPFMLPQENPLYPEGYAWQLNRPELVGGQIDIDAEELKDFIMKPPLPVVFEGDTTVDVISGPTILEKEPVNHH